MADFNENKLTYQQIVMKQITIIQNICSKELRDCEKTLKTVLGEQIIEGEDTRYSYLQSIEVFGALLSPYFSKAVSDEFDNFCNLNYLNLIEALDNSLLKEDIANFFFIKSSSKKETLKFIHQNNLGQEINIFLLNYKIKIARRMFRILLKSFKDLDFLGNEAYSEGSATLDEGLDADGDDFEEEGDVFEKEE